MMSIRNNEWFAYTIYCFLHFKRHIEKVISLTFRIRGFIVKYTKSFTNKEVLHFFLKAVV